MRPAIRRSFLALAIALAFAPCVLAAPTAPKDVKDPEGRILRVLDVSGNRDMMSTKPDVSAPAPGFPFAPSGPSFAGQGAAAPATPIPLGGNDSWPMFQANAAHTGFLPIDLDHHHLAFTGDRELHVGQGVLHRAGVGHEDVELSALRRLTTAAFGTLMSLEPAIALAVGLLLLGQVPGWAPVVGIGLVVLAGIGAERTGARATT